MKLNNRQLKRLKTLYNTSANITEAAKKLASEMGIEYGDPFRRKCSKILERLKVTNNKVRIEDSESFKTASKRELSNKKYYIITWEQNETPIHQELYSNILAYKEFLNAEMSVILGRYKNPTSVLQTRNAIIGMSKHALIGTQENITFINI